MTPITLGGPESGIVPRFGKPTQIDEGSKQSAGLYEVGQQAYLFSGNQPDSNKTVMLVVEKGTIVKIVASNMP